MILKGYKVRKSKTIGWKYPEKGDLDLYGNQVESNYFCIVNKKDCKIVEENGKRCYVSKGVKKTIPIAYFGTYYGAGKLKKDRLDSYYRNIYFVHNAVVYVGRIKYNQEEVERQKQLDKRQESFQNA